VTVDVDLPEIRAWARLELPGCTDNQVDGVVDEWASVDATRRELLWLEHALRLRRSRVTEAGVAGDSFGAPTASA
jgi:hypothetical protein